jgi:hypothetical protein
LKQHHLVMVAQAAKLQIVFQITLV